MLDILSLQAGLTGCLIFITESRPQRMLNIYHCKQASQDAGYFITASRPHRMLAILSLQAGLKGCWIFEH
jgi:hypothetical protein